MTAPSKFDLIRAALGALPAALQAFADGDVAPLAMGTREALTERLIASGMGLQEAARLAAKALRDVAVTSAYQREVAIEHSRRIDLDGNPVERVEPGHAAAAASLLLARSLVTEQRRAPPVAEKAPPPKPVAPPKPVDAAPRPKPRPNVGVRRY